MTNETKLQSGKKYTTNQGFSAVKDGIKSKVEKPIRTKKPEWLKAARVSSKDFLKVRDITNTHNLSTVCSEAKCPNINECWSHGTATMMLMGSVCTRACKFCAVDTGNPHGWLDNDEPMSIAKSVALMKLKYVVLTSVDRDDLDDGGAKHIADTITAIKTHSPETKVEALTPDFSGNTDSIDTVLATAVDVLAQNIEVVKRLTKDVRDPRASYQQTLNFLKYVKEQNPELKTKTSIMVGIGETDEEVYQAMDDLLAVGVDILTLGQYLQPTKNHLEVDRFVTPQQFMKYRHLGLEKGFMEVASGPLVRSSYRADKVFEKNNLGL